MVVIWVLPAIFSISSFCFAVKVHLLNISPVVRSRTTPTNLPFLLKSSSALRSVISVYGGIYRVAFRHPPLPIQSALIAAHVFVCNFRTCQAASSSGAAPLVLPPKQVEQVHGTRQLAGGTAPAAAGDGTRALTAAGGQVHTSPRLTLDVCARPLGLSFPVHCFDMCQASI